MMLHALVVEFRELADAVVAHLCPSDVASLAVSSAILRAYLRTQLTSWQHHMRCMRLISSITYATAPVYEHTLDEPFEASMRVHSGRRTYYYSYITQRHCDQHRDADQHLLRVVDGVGAREDSNVCTFIRDYPEDIYELPPQLRPAPTLCAMIECTFKVLVGALSIPDCMRLRMCCRELSTKLALYVKRRADRLSPFSVRFRELFDTLVLPQLRPRDVAALMCTGVQFGRLRTSVQATHWRNLQPVARSLRAISWRHVGAVSTRITPRGPVFYWHARERLEILRPGDVNRPDSGACRSRSCTYRDMSQYYNQSYHVPKIPLAIVPPSWLTLCMLLASGIGPCVIQHLSRRDCVRLRECQRAIGCNYGVRYASRGGPVIVNCGHPTRQRVTYLE